MKKFFQEFKAFISRGNVMDLAVGVIIGSAFTGVVTSLTDSIIKPLLNCIGGAEIQGKIHLLGDNYLDYGAFLSAVVNFLIMALIIFCMVKGLNKLSDAVKHATHEKEAQAGNHHQGLPLLQERDRHGLPPAVPTAPRCWRTEKAG